MVPYKKQPALTVKISLNERFNFQSEPVLLNLTIESIYNISKAMRTTDNNEIDCQTCIHLVVS